MKLKRQTITVKAELENGKEAIIKFARVKQNLLLKRLSDADRYNQRRKDLFKGFTDDAKFEEQLKTLSPKQVEEMLELSHAATLSWREYMQAVLSSCISVEGLEFDGESISLSSIRLGEIPADIAEQLTNAYTLAEQEERNKPEADAKNENGQIAQSNASNSDSSTSTE